MIRTMLSTVCYQYDLFPSYSLFLVNAIQSLQLSEEQKKEILQHLKEKLLPWQILKRLEAIRLVATGLTQTIVAKQLCVRRELVNEYVRIYRLNGINGIIHMDKPGKETKLTEEMFEALETYIDQEDGKRLTNKELVNWLEDKYNVSISPDWLGYRLSLRKREKKEEPWR